DQLARHRAVAEGHDAGAVLELRVDDEAGDETGVKRAHVAQRVPDVLGAGVDRDLLADGSHRALSCRLWACRPPGCAIRIGCAEGRDLAKIALRRFPCGTTSRRSGSWLPPGCARRRRVTPRRCWD